MTYSTVTGYPYDGYDGTDESFEKLLDQIPCPERHPQDGASCICYAHAEGDHRDCHGRTWPNEAALTDLGPCTRNPEHGPAEVPWSGDRLCWDCADHELDLLAKALQSEGGWPVQVGSGHPGHRQELSTEDHREGGRQ
jgi:hypothetical protein